MPIPKPKPGQKKEDFISGCMSDLKDEFPETAQRYAVCISGWEEKFNSIVSNLKNRDNSVQNIKLK